MEKVGERAFWASQIDLENFHGFPLKAFSCFLEDLC